MIILFILLFLKLRLEGEKYVILYSVSPTKKNFPETSFCEKVLKNVEKNKVEKNINRYLIYY
tara:strand:- start:546 stop:731 length:186 start_codon:yes stop_codon:yes gene_type:complete